MAGISTTLTLRDKFSNTVNKVIDASNRLLKTMRRVDVQSIKMSPVKGLTDAAPKIDAANAKLNKFNQEQKEAGKESRGILRNWEEMSGAVQGALAAYGITQVAQLADSMTTTNARLGLMAGSEKEVEELEVLIMQSANRARASYQSTADAVAKMGIMAKDAFDNNKEVIKFTEVINKQFAIAGTTTEGAEAAMLQLTQAMAGGVLRGEELNSVFEQAPTIIQTLAEQLNVPIGKIREMAEQGKLTSKVVKTAMLNAADEVDKKFDKMPMTFAQVWTISMNALLKIFNPVIQAIGRGAQWFYDNWSSIAPIFVGLAAGVAVFAAAMAVKTAVTWLAVAANRALLVSMLTNPYMWVALAIGVIVGAIYKWIQSVGGIKIAWMMVTNSLLYAVDLIKYGFFAGVNYVLDLFGQLQLGWTTAVTAIKNWAGDLKASVLNTLQDLVNGAINTINSLINMANKIPGVNIEVIDKVTFGASAQIENEIAKQARNKQLADYGNELTKKSQQREKDLQKMLTEAQHAKKMRDHEIKVAQAAKKAEAAANDKGLTFNKEALKIDKVGKVGEVGKIKQDVNIAEEDLQLMKDVAEMRYVQNFVTLTPTVAMQASISEKVDVNNVIGEIERRLEEEFAAAAEGHYM